jgi:hypothetical protein
MNNEKTNCRNCNKLILVNYIGISVKKMKNTTEHFCFTDNCLEKGLRIMKKFKDFEVIKGTVKEILKVYHSKE